MESSLGSILIVDDESSRENLRLTLSQEGYETEIAGTGRAALEQAQEILFDVAVVGVSLPDMGGIELVAPLQAIQPDLAVIVVFKSPSPEAAVQALNEGASAYVVKPFNMDEVLITLRQVFEKQRLLIENRHLQRELQQELTERKWNDALLRQRNSELTLLNHAIQTVNSTLKLDELLVLVLDETRRLLNITACSIWLVDPESKDLVCQQATAPYNENVVGRRLAPGQGLAGQVIASGRSLVVSDAFADERYYHEFADQTGEKLRSVLTVPIRVDGETVGVIQAVDEDVDRFRLTDLALMKSLTAAATSAIRNARLFSNLEKAQDQLVRQERLTALGQMAATVAHEMRNPIMAIRMGIDYLLRDISETDPRHHGSSLIRTNMDRIDRIVSNILFLTRPTGPNLASGRLQPIIEEEIANWESRLAEKSITCRLELTEDLPPIKLDPHQMVRAFSNLINNSVEALLPGGYLHIGLDSAEHQSQVITLADDGPGISPENLPRIFDPFFSTRSRGTGLGLAIVKQIIDDHQGNVDVWSEPGSGTKFTITLHQSPLVKA
jgi:signal transduction histidine kinase/DNA-binding response OmpR family regulator